jgi:hypothetical protein
MTGGKPAAPRCTLERFIPTHIDVEDVKSDGWNDHRILVVGADDTRINWMERQVIEQIGEKLYRDRRSSRG